MDSIKDPFDKATLKFEVPQIHLLKPEGENGQNEAKQKQYAQMLLDQTEKRNAIFFLGLANNTPKRSKSAFWTRGLGRT